ncbi:MAG: helix-turn-helix transcriptional regulator [Arcticibacter sp.]
MRTNRFLQLLKTRGPLNAKAIASELGMTSEGARQHLIKLTEDGLLKPSSISNGVGRPVQIYELTEYGHAHFPNNHAALSVELLQAIKNELGEEALEVVLVKRETEAVKRYAELLKDEKDLASILRKYTQIRSQEGYMAECITVSEHEFTLLENHCPIGAASSACSGFCHSDMKILQQVLGPEVNIVQEHTIARGQRICSYTIRLPEKK